MLQVVQAQSKTGKIAGGIAVAYMFPMNNHLPAYDLKVNQPGAAEAHRSPCQNVGRPVLVLKDPAHSHEPRHSLGQPVVIGVVLCYHGGQGEGGGGVTGGHGMV